MALVLLLVLAALVVQQVSPPHAAIARESLEGVAAEVKEYGRAGLETLQEFVRYCAHKKGWSLPTRLQYPH
jgi:hypothetical protein